MNIHKYQQSLAKIGGQYRLTVLLEKRIKELKQGERPLVDASPNTSLDNIALEEILQDKIALVLEEDLVRE